MTLVTKKKHITPQADIDKHPLLVGPFEGGGAQRTKDFWQKSGKQIVNRGREPKLRFRNQFYGERRNTLYTYIET